MSAIVPAQKLIVQPIHLGGGWPAKLSYGEMLKAIGAGLHMVTIDDST